jgi:tetratricopeptide (TPR) repeat protein
MTTIRDKAVTALIALALVAAAAAEPTSEPTGRRGSGLPPGLESYLEARVYEANGQFRDAMDAYEKASGQAPESAEIRLSFASFLVDVGMADRALDLLADIPDLDAEGLRLRALALAQQASRDPSLLAETETALREAVDANEFDANLMFSLAQILSQQQKVDEAEQVMSELRRSIPSNSRLVVMHAGLLRALGRLPEAVELFEDCAEVGPSASECRDQYVEIMVELGRPGEAGQSMVVWLSDNDLDGLMRAAALLWEGRRYELALQTVRRVLARAPDAPQARLLEAHLLSSVGDHEAAVDRLGKLIKEKPREVDLLLAMAWSTGILGESDESRRWLDRAWDVVAGPPASDGTVRVALTAARLELVTDHPNLSREWLDRVADPSTGGSEYVRILAESYRRQELWREGASALTRVQPRLSGLPQREAEAFEAEFLLRMNDSRGWRRLQPLLESDSLGEVLVALQVLQTVEKWHEVEQSSGEAIDRLGPDRALLFTRAAALERLSEYDKAAALFRRLLDENPDDAASANYLGYMLADQGTQLDEAYDLISRAVEMDPDNVAYLDSLGWVYYRRGNLAEAERWIRRAIELGGDLGDGTIYCHLGEILLARGQRDEGRRFLQLGFDMGCDDPEHVQSLIEQSDDAGQ